jgi:hypothetical protein
MLMIFHGDERISVWEDIEDPALLERAAEIGYDAEASLVRLLCIYDKWEELVIYDVRSDDNPLHYMENAESDLWKRIASNPSLTLLPALDRVKT